MIWFDLHSSKRVEEADLPATCLYPVSSDPVVKGLNPEHWGAQASRHYCVLELVDGTLMNNVVFCSTGPQSLNPQLLGQVAFHNLRMFRILERYYDAYTMYYVTAPVGAGAAPQNHITISAVKHEYSHFFFFFHRRYNPLWVLAFSVILLHSVLSLLSFLHPLIPNAWMSSSISSTHLFLGLPLILLPVGFHSNTLLGILFSSIHITCPNQANLLLFMDLTMSAFPMSSFKA